MRTLFTYLAFGLLISCFSACQPGQQGNTTAEAPSQPKNIILLIGDGMGLTQVSTVYYFNNGQPSNFSRFPYIGLINTSSSSHKITDSAAGATAFSAGEKTYNGAIGVDSNKGQIKTILEIAAEGSRATGVVSTSSITHATPASFYAHVPKRSMQDEIARQMLDAPVDFFAGGGIRFFARREDGQDLLKEMEAIHFDVDTTALTKPNWEQGRKYGFLLADDGMPRMLDGRGDFLPNASEMALEFLSSKEKGFFLMIEGSQIDWGGHANDAEYIITEMLDFDKAIGKALDFAEQDGNTLVIVTADHETGGFALSSAPKESGGSDYDEIGFTFSTGGHTTTLIPVFAYGPGAEKFSGIYQNNEIFHKMLELSQWGSPAQ